MKVTLIVSGSIAAYQSAELVRELVKAGNEVHVVMTSGAEKFITSLTMQTLSGKPVTTELFDEAREAQINHIRLADIPDVVVVAPASANILAKMAGGIADDAATTVLLATRAPIVVAPAMNVNMWFHPATQENIQRLKQRGVMIVPPGEGALACGWEGAGRLPELGIIVSAVQSAREKQDLSGYRIVVSAGPTREAIDPMRFVSNRSSGKMGYAIAKRAERRGAEVVLVSGPVALDPPSGVSISRVTTASEMKTAIWSVLEKPGDSNVSKQAMIMSAAVCDHRPESPAKSKLKQAERAPYSLSLIPNEDILKSVGAERSAIVQKSGLPLNLVGFAAETGTEDDLLRLAEGKLLAKNLDLIVANRIEDSAETDETTVWLLGKGGVKRKVELAAKDTVADKILDTLLGL